MTESARERLQALLDSHYPFGDVQVETASPARARLRKRIEPRHLRLGGTVAGPTLMALADAAVYLALQMEPAPMLDAVTSQLTIHFLRRPAARDVVADARILRLGRTLAVGEALLYSDGDSEPVAHATVTYALPRSGDL
jgi:uncharacterized protein (TIGR00369 family)